MIRYTRFAGLLLLFFILSLPAAQAQNTENPGDYITAISNARGDMDVKYMQYLSAVAHGKRARKVEKLRLQVLETITQSRYKTTDLGYFKGDKTLRQGSIDYIQLCYRVFDEDYRKIVDMEELAEQSFDEMQAYLLLQEKVDQKLNEATDNLHKIVEAFAAKYNVTLVDKKSALGAKMEAAGNLNHYMNQVYLLFFKCNWQDEKMVTAMNSKKVNDIEQARSALLRYANEGIQALDTLRLFNNDPTLSNSCRQVLQFYKNMAEKDAPKFADYFIKEESFEKLKKSFNAKGNKTQQEIDGYNKAVKDINDAGNAFNQVNNSVNKGRTKAINDWNQTQNKFADTHMPYYR